jgi:hypothetical protein
LEKSKIIEKLFLHIVIFSYLILPIGFLFLKEKKGIIPISLAIYGIIFFCLLFFYPDLPKYFKTLFKGFYTLIEYLTFSFFLLITIKQSRARLFISIVSIFFITFQLIYIFTTKVNRLDTVPVGIETILLLIFIIMFLLEFSRQTSIYIYNHYCFWIATGIFIYLGGSFFFFILVDHLSDSEISTFGNLTYLAEVIKNILFVLAMFVSARHPFESIPKKSNSLPFLDMI